MNSSIKDKQFSLEFDREIEKEQTGRIADTEIVANDPAFAGAQYNDVVPGGHAGDNAATFRRVPL